jgi:N utilization substance protein B
MSRFNKMNRQEKRSSRLLALQLMYANEITTVKNRSFFNEIFNLSSAINGATDKHEILSNLEISSEMALSVLPQVINDKFAKIKKLLSRKNVDEIIKLINEFQTDLNKYKKNIQAYALEIFRVSKKNIKVFDKEIILRSENWDSSRITLMDKLILRLVMAEIMYIDHVPPKVSIAEGIEIAKTMSTEDSGAFVNGILDSFFSDWSKGKK